MNEFSKVHDRRNRRMRGLWIRNGIFYAQLWVENRCTKVRLLHAKTVPEAVLALQALKLKRANGEQVTQPRSSKTFRDAALAYQQEVAMLASKRPATILRERSSIDSLVLFFGDRPVSQVAMPDTYAYANWRKEHSRRSESNGVSGRAIDIDIVTLRNVMKKAVRDGVLKHQPIGEWKRLANKPREIRLMSTSEVEQLRAAGCQQFSDYLGVLAASGGRERETLRLRWSINVDWERKRLGFGQDGLSKFAKSRWLPFNPPLEALLIDLYFRTPASDLVFPSPRGGGFIHSFKKSLAGAKARCGIRDVGFHHFRHYFISHCLMSGVDVKTVADWVGHNDIMLISKIYGHISSKHSVQQAAKVKFGN